jgi:hypothetical protein
MFSIITKYFFILALLFATGAQHVCAALFAANNHWDNISYVESNLCDDGYFETFALMPFIDRNQIDSGSGHKIESFLITKSEDEVESEELISHASSDKEQNFFIANFATPSFGVICNRIKNIKSPFTFFEISSTPRFILFQDFRI